MSSSARLNEISQNLAAVEREVSIAVEKSNRQRAEITLIAVTKNFPVSDVVHLYDLGIRNFGENRDDHFHMGLDIKTNGVIGANALVHGEDIIISHRFCKYFNSSTR